jgi:transposase
MSLPRISTYEVPLQTARIAQAIFPTGNLYMQLYEHFATLNKDEDFVDLFSQTGQPAEAPWLLVLVLILQFIENLSDRQAVEAVRTRIDWKYLLRLDLEDRGFHHSVLSEFRSRLLQGQVEQRLLDHLLKFCQEHAWLKAGGKQRSDSTHVLGATRALNRLECVGETLRHALNVLAVIVPDWLLQSSEPDWLERYGPRVEDYRLPKSAAQRIWSRVSFLE